MGGWLERHQYLVLAVLALVMVAGIIYPRLTEESPPPLVFQQGSGLPEGAPIRVHVTGAVARPGVYELREGDRLAEALDAAGGAAAGANLEGLNLARRVRDEEQVVVSQRPGAATTTTGPGASSTSVTTTGAGASANLSPGAKVDINTANEAQLDQLPGIGEAYSRRIVDSRKLDGNFKSTEDLVTRRVLPRATYDRIRDLISVSP